MKFVRSLIVLFLSLFPVACTTSPIILTRADLVDSSINKTVVLSGIYADHFKGGARIDCGFVTFEIEGHGLSNEISPGTFVSVIQDGTKISISCVIRRSKPSRYKDDPNMPSQRAVVSGSYIDAKGYTIEPPRIYVTDCKLLRKF